jgi:hypothetical protein
MALVCILRTVFEQLVNSRADTTLNIFYDGISFQALANVLVSLFTLRYLPRLFSCSTLNLSSGCAVYMHMGLKRACAGMCRCIFRLNGQFCINVIF